MPKYGDLKYWEDRYKSLNGSTFDWLEDYETLKDLLKEMINDEKEKAVIMNLGCGNAELEEKMYDDGYKNVMNIDISEHVIKFKQERNALRKELTCKIIFII